MAEVELEGAIAPMMALRAYVALDEHDPALWRAIVRGAKTLGAADPAMVAGLLVDARAVKGAPKGEIATVAGIVKTEARRVTRERAAEKKAGGSVVRMDGSPLGEEDGPRDRLLYSVSQALRHIGHDYDGEDLPCPMPYRLGTVGDNVRLMVDRGEDGQELLVQIAPAALFVVGKSAVRHRNGGNIATYLTVAWRRDGQVRTATIPSEVLADRTRFGRLRALDIPIPVKHASTVAEWLSACEEAAHEAGALPVQTACRGMGWVSEDPGDGFLHGVDLIGGCGPVVQVPPVRARTVYEAHGLGGSWEGWREKVWGIANLHPRVMLGIYAACAAALVGPLDADPFLFEYGSRTSGGKSRALSLAASVWGQPRGSRQIVAKWGSTHVGTMRRGSDSPGIPLIMDDTKEILTQAGGKEDLAKRVYALLNAGGRMKADKDDPEGWEADSAPRIVILTGGETPIADIMHRHPGAIARIVTVRTPPWEVGGDEGAKLADATELDASEHYGHAGRRLVAWLTARTPRAWEKLRARYRELVGEHRRATATAGSSQRGASHLAIIHLAGLCASEAWGLPFCEAALREATTATADQVDAADVPMHAYHALWAHLATRPHQVQQSEHENQPPSSGYIGRRMPPGMGIFAIPSGEAERAVTLAGFDFRDSLGEWIAKRWVTKRAVRIAGTPVKCLVLTHPVSED
jgi:hypothetical protein